MNNVWEAIAFLNDNPATSWSKETFSPAEQLAIIALRPFLEPIGGRIALMIDMAIESKAPKP